MLNRDLRAQRDTLRRLGFVVALQAFVVCAWLVLTILEFSLSALSGVTFLWVPVLSVGVLVMYVRIYLVHRALRNLRIVLSFEGVTYASDVGTFTAPWPAVRKVRTRRGGRYFSVRARGWGGPVSGFGLFGELVVRLGGAGVAPSEIQGALWYFSNGTVRM
jgi:hypothetical protein